MLTALRLLQSQIIISPLLYDEYGKNVILHSGVFHRKMIHKLISLQEPTIVFCIRKPVFFFA